MLKKELLQKISDLETQIIKERYEALKLICVHIPNFYGWRSQSGLGIHNDTFSFPSFWTIPFTYELINLPNSLEYLEQLAQLQNRLKLN